MAKRKSGPTPALADRPIDEIFTDDVVFPDTKNGKNAMAGQEAVRACVGGAAMDHEPMSSNIIDTLANIIHLLYLMGLKPEQVQGLWNQADEHAAIELREDGQ